MTYKELVAKIDAQLAKSAEIIKEAKKITK